MSLNIYNTARVLFIGFIVSILINSCKDSVNGPRSLQQNNGIYLYAGRIGGKQIYIVDTDSNKVIDSLTGFNSIKSLAITKGGQILYVTDGIANNNSEGIIYSINSVTKARSIISDRPGGIFIEPEGIPLIISPIPNDTLSVVGTIDTVNNTISFFDTLNIYNYQSGNLILTFDPTLPIFYTLTKSNKLYSYDYKNKRVLKYYNSIGIPFHNMKITPDGKYIYFAGGPVLEVAFDTVVAFLSSNYNASLALSHDSKYLYMTDPGLPNTISSARVYIYQTNTNKLVGSIDVSNNTVRESTNSIVLKSDGITAYVSDKLNTIFVINLNTQSVITNVNLPNNSSSQLSIQLLLGSE